MPAVSNDTRSDARFTLSPLLGRGRVPGSGHADVSAGSISSNAPGREQRAERFPAPSAQRVSGAPDARRLPVRSLERPAERLLRVVPDPPCDRADAEVGRREQVLGDVHAPFGEIADGRTAEDLTEARVEHRAR